MAKFLQNRAVRLFRTIFRWFRILVLFVVFLAVVCVAYFHLIGLPDFVKEPVLAKLRNQGLEIEFTRIRLGWDQKILIENAAFSSTNHAISPKLTTARTEIAINFRALLQKQLRLNSLMVDRAQLRMPLVQSNHFASLDDVQLKLKFLPNDLLRLENFDAGFRGAKLHLSGSITNMSAVKTWPVLHARAKTNQNFQANLERFVAQWDKVRFSAPPGLDVSINGDARDFNSFEVESTITISGAKASFGTLKGLTLTANGARLFDPVAKNFVKLRVAADEAVAPNGAGSKVDLKATLSRNVTDTNRFDGDLILALGALSANWTNQIQSNWIRASQIQFSDHVEFSPTNLASLALAGKLKIARGESRWGAAENIKIGIESTNVVAPVETDASWGVWARLAPFAVNWAAEVSKVKSPKIEVEALQVSGQWRAPELTVEKLNAQLYGKSLNGSARLSVGTREVHAQMHSDCDPKKITELLTPAGQHFLSQFEWDPPPVIDGSLIVVLPAWTNKQPDWRAEVLPTLRIEGKFSAQHGAFRGVSVSSANSQFTYVNRTWHLPRLHAIREDGDAFMEYTGSDSTHDYHFVVESHVSPKIAKPLLESEKQQQVLDELEFTGAPEIHADIWGRWHARELIGVNAQVTATNFMFRGQKVDTLSAKVAYTNLLLSITDARITRDSRELKAPKVEADFSSKRVSLTNAFSTIDPMLVARVISPKAVTVLAPYQFETPPTLHGYGSFLMRDPNGTDMHIDIVGDNFHWTNLFADKVSGRLNWIGRSIRLTNVFAHLYGKGQGKGWGQFDYLPERGTDFQFHFSVVDISLPLAAQSLSGKTNKLEGMLDGDLTITGGNARHKRSWQGFGRANVHDAVLWEIPIFGIFSPVLNAIAPGAGTSRAREASTTFIVTNGLVYTDDLEIRAAGYRLAYKGGIDVEQQLVDARVEAELLRDAWVIGRVLSLALTPLSKLFEYHITGPVRQPRMEPTYIPKFLMMTLRPFHTLKNLASPGQEPAPVDPPLPK